MMALWREPSSRWLAWVEGPGPPWTSIMLCCFVFPLGFFQRSQQGALLHRVGRVFASLRNGECSLLFSGLALMSYVPLLLLQQFCVRRILCAVALAFWFGVSSARRAIVAPVVCREFFYSVSTFLTVSSQSAAWRCLLNSCQPFCLGPTPTSVLSSDEELALKRAQQQRSNTWNVCDRVSRSAAVSPQTPQIFPSLFSVLCASLSAVPCPPLWCSAGGRAKAKAGPLLTPTASVPCSPCLVSCGCLCVVWMGWVLLTFPLCAIVCVISAREVWRLLVYVARLSVMLSLCAVAAVLPCPPFLVNCSDVYMVVMLCGDSVTTSDVCMAPCGLCSAVLWVDALCVCVGV